MPDGDNRVTRAFLRYRDVLVRSLLRMSVKPADVDDILQESLARALEADEKKRLEFPKSYLFAVSRNMVFREQQRSRREVQWEIDEAILQSGAAPTDEEIHYAQMLQAFWEAVKSLPKAHQRVILLRRIYGLSQKEIAKKMGVSVSSTEKYFAQGIRRCRDVMKRRGFTLAQMGEKTVDMSKKAPTRISASDGKGRSND